MFFKSVAFLKGQFTLRVPQVHGEFNFDLNVIILSTYGDQSIILSGRGLSGEGDIWLYFFFLSLFLSLSLLFFYFLGLHPLHMEVPRLRVQLEV